MAGCRQFPLLVLPADEYIDVSSDRPCMELWNMAEDRGCIGPRPPLPPDAELEPLPL